MKGQPFIRRLGFALHGVRLAFVREQSFRVHVVATSVVLGALAVSRPEPVWWALGMLAVGLVLVAELINTALETLVDHLHPDIHPEIRAAKDAAAGAVLVASLVAIGIAIAFLSR